MTPHLLVFLIHPHSQGVTLTIELNVDLIRDHDRPFRPLELLFVVHETHTIVVLVRRTTVVLKVLNISTLYYVDPPASSTV